MHAGFITLIGRPNAGKSTLLNAVLGQKISIISAKPQTTRNRILGIYNGEGVQIIMVDTPGLHQAKGRLNRAMVGVATDSLQDVDAVCWVLDASGPAHRIASGALPSKILTKAESRVLALIERSKVEKVSIALNKIDLLSHNALLPLIAALSKRLPDAEIVPISALKNSSVKFSGGVDRLLTVWKGHIPESPALYPTDHQPTTWDSFARTAINGEPAQTVADDLGIDVGAVYLARSRVMARLRKMVEEVTVETIAYESGDECEEAS